MARRIGKRGTAAILGLVGAFAMLGDDVGALLDQAFYTPWMFSPADRRPVGTWDGAATFGDAGARPLSLRLDADELSDTDSQHRSTGGNGFFVRRIHRYRGSPFLKGELVVGGADGTRDTYEVEGPVGYTGRDATLNVHGAEGRAGVLVEQAVARFVPPRVELTLRYRIPASTTRQPGPVFSYVQAGTAWTAAAGPARADLARTGSSR